MVVTGLKETKESSNSRWSVKDGASVGSNIAKNKKCCFDYILVNDREFSKILVYLNGLAFYPAVVCLMHASLSAH